MKLSEPQKQTLLHYFKRKQRIIHGTRGDSIFVALGRRGLATWNSNIGQRYGRPSWWITDDGVAEAKALAAAERTQP